MIDLFEGIATSLLLVHHESQLLYIEMIDLFEGIATITFLFYAYFFINIEMIDLFEGIATYR